MFNDLIKNLRIFEKKRLDKEYYLELLSHDAYEYYSLPEEFKNDEDIIITAITREPYVLNYISHEIKDNAKYIEIAVNKNYRSLMYASKRLQNDEDIINKTLIAMGCEKEHHRDYYYALGCMAESILDNEKFVSLALAKRKDMFLPPKFASQRITNLVEHVNDPVEFLKAYSHKTIIEKSLSQIPLNSIPTKRKKL
ncbi:DUF4116 domain-containing protein [Methylovorus glucosotrophus]|uniref:DUF4116 domain-containing protein n=1 Tax=Methylovorus glucosotrophus (strain SIP3-4) TaxID=582744 RepID=C6X7Y2_METGS|nr:DUF4116 domain-containing protein [Methylovorus glucosotrophus]ACT51309.1 hypothetical protein Msip34_2067 [Methylovorus glucosotrophus SIP3-4]